MLAGTGLFTYVTTTEFCELCKLCLKMCSNEQDFHLSRKVCRCAALSVIKSVDT